VLRTLIRSFSAVLFILCAFAVLFALWRLSPAKIAETYRFLCPRLKDSWLVMAASRDFTRFFLECVRRKVPTMQALRMLKQMKEKPLVALIASELDESLMNGTSFEKAMASPYVESALARFIHLAAAAANAETMLEGYLAMSAKRTEAAIRRFSACVQLFSYSLIGLVLIFVYSILMLPMTMLQQI
jgi:type II secretory pathway component PulF